MNFAPVAFNLVGLFVMGSVAVLAGTRLVGIVFRRVDASAPRPGVTEAAQQLRGGLWIGCLERLAVFAALVTHHPEGIAVCLAIKGLARYPELQATTSGAAERFIIGTFVSVLFACVCAGIALWLVGPVNAWIW